MAQHPSSSENLSRTLKPLCPRHNRVMDYEEKGIRWSEGTTSEVQTNSSYHCNYFGCSVRYSHTDGYFTVVDTPDRPQFIEEPGANILQCPRQGSWLYRSEGDSREVSFAWRCGVEGCDYYRSGIAATKAAT
jgi:hypothetical protein